MDLFIKKNKKIFFLTITVLLFVSFFSIKFYIQEKKNSEAIRIKTSMMSKTKKTAKPWGKLLNPQPVKLSPTTAKIIEEKISTKAAATIRQESPEIPKVAIVNQSTSELANSLDSRMKKVTALSIADLQRNIEMADEIISREPDSYSAYKAKLISYLVEEGKFNQQIDDAEINSLLEAMASFDVTNDAVIKKEAELIANASKEIELLNQTISDLSDERDEIESELESTEVDSLNFRALIEKRGDLLSKEEEALSQRSILQISIDSGYFPEESYINEDIVQIPFMRQLAKNDYDGAISSAEVFISEFPDSPIGYFYLVKALEFSGRYEEASEALKKAQLTSEARTTLEQRLNLAKTQNPKYYWQRLNF